jgi:hypothetical protein
MAQPAHAQRLDQRCGLVARAGAGRPPLDRLVDITNLARFGGEPPGEPMADEAWTAEADVATALRSSRSVLMRARVAADPRPLLRRR